MFVGYTVVAAFQVRDPTSYRSNRNCCQARAQDVASQAYDIQICTRALEEQPGIYWRITITKTGQPSKEPAGQNLMWNSESLEKLLMLLSKLCPRKQITISGLRKAYGTIPYQRKLKAENGSFPEEA